MSIDQCMQDAFLPEKDPQTVLLAEYRRAGVNPDNPNERIHYLKPLVFIPDCSERNVPLYELELQHLKDIGFDWL